MNTRFPLQASNITHSVTLPVDMGPERASWHAPPRATVTVLVRSPLCSGPARIPALDAVLLPSVPSCLQPDQLLGGMHSKGVQISSRHLALRPMALRPRSNFQNSVSPAVHCAFA